MAEPEWDKSTGRWYVRYHVPGPGGPRRIKKTLPKHDGWRKLEARPRSIPGQVLLWARPFQDIDASTKLGHDVKAPRSTPLAGFLKDYQASYALSRRPNSARGLSNAIRRFLEHCELAKVASVEAVGVAVCREYMEGMRRAGLGWNTVATDRGLLGGAWSRAVRERQADYNPWRALDVPGANDGGGTPSWTRTEVDALLGELRGWARDVFRVGINCGFRCQAIRNMRWGWVAWEAPRRRRGLLRCPKEWSKGGQAYEVPLFRDLHDVLAERLARAERSGKADLVFPGRCDDGGVNASWFSKSLEAASRKAGVEWRGHAWHAMRSTFATRYLEMGASPRSVQAWMSHSSLQMTDKYLGWSGEAEDDEVDRLEGKAGGETPPTPDGP